MGVRIIYIEQKSITRRLEGVKIIEGYTLELLVERFRYLIPNLGVSGTYLMGIELQPESPLAV